MQLHMKLTRSGEVESLTTFLNVDFLKPDKYVANRAGLSFKPRHTLSNLDTTEISHIAIIAREINSILTHRQSSVILRASCLG